MKKLLVGILVLAALLAGSAISSSRTEAAVMSYELYSGIPAGPNDLTPGIMQSFFIEVPAGAEMLSANVKGSIPIDLYLKFGSVGGPGQANDCFRPAATRACEEFDPYAGRWFVGVVGSSAGTFMLTATYTMKVTTPSPQPPAAPNPGVACPDDKSPDPAGLVAKKGSASGEINLGWNAAGGCTTGYYIYWSTVNDILTVTAPDQVRKVGGAASTSYQFIGAPNKVYFFWLFTFGACDCQSSSMTVTASTVSGSGSGTQPPVVAPPSPPVPPVVAPPSQPVPPTTPPVVAPPSSPAPPTTPPAPSLYAIAGNVGRPFATISLTGTTTTAAKTVTSTAYGAYEIAGLPAGTYTLKSTLQGCTFSPATKTVVLSANLTGVDFKISCPLATKPTEFAGSVASPSEVTLKWKDNATNETAYVISRREGIQIIEMARVGANVTSRKIAGLTAATSYSFQVCAISPSGEPSCAQSSVQLTTKALPTYNVTFQMRANSLDCNQPTTDPFGYATRVSINGQLVNATATPYRYPLNLFTGGSANGCDIKVTGVGIDFSKPVTFKVEAYGYSLANHYYYTICQSGSLKQPAFSFMEPDKIILSNSC